MFPIGACLAKEKAACVLTAGSHGSTFGGNPLAVAVGNAVLDVLLADGFLEQVQRVAGRLHAKLEEFARRQPDLIEEVRGEGLMIGLKCRVPNTDVIARLRANRMLTAGAGDNVVRLLPPLIIDDSHIEEGLGILEHTAAAWQVA